ncbi:hypothetical protein MYCTH_98083 [Thermothelomyces thermophilus ATCC 42464]|uniref:Uncharacterized protein n=1 Tax=Thermothelomyces thermophilus (strain ATCC 42464 / BCRC 31852 / DSM 1799) TaxID=573729 RepID=G2QLK1_THET4|nr:uncharacterized protein MYCTH_98083 [Thermothelomyces thermophilus ATCC 42464]AEO60831.1 hypothetical protein MYCTH_98083 [Thermothelomyces thermophilus ATCC 42464]
MAISNMASISSSLMSSMPSLTRFCGKERKLESFEDITAKAALKVTKVSQTPFGLGWAGLFIE